MSQDKFDKDYYNWLRKVEVTEADSVWEDVQYELDFADTWSSISRELDRVAPVSSGLLQGSLMKTAVIATTMLFLLIVPAKRLDDPGAPRELITLSDVPLTGNMDASPVVKIPVEQSTPQFESSPEMATESIQTDMPAKKSIAETNGKITTTEKIAIEKPSVIITTPDVYAEETGISIVPESSGIAWPADPSPPDPLHDDSQGERTGKEALSKLILSEKPTERLEKLDPGNFRVHPALVFNNINNRKIISDINREHMVTRFTIPFSFVPGSYNSSSPRSSLKLMDLGIIYSYKNTWLINYETLNGLNPEKLGNTLPTFHKDIGISSTFLLKERHYMGLDFMIKSEAGQNYEQYINASYLRRDIQLDYSKLQGYYIWYRGRIPGQLLTGGYLARLNLGEESLRDETITISDNYRNYDYGLMVGYQLTLFLQNKIIVRPGFRLNYNLVNVFRGDELTPGYLKDTRNFAAGFMISLSYRFSN